MSALISQYTPSLNAKGFYQLAAPYAALVSATQQYTCVGVITIQGAIAQGIDVLNTIYIASGDTEANYNSDLQNGVSLITISSGTGSLIQFPNSAMLSVPQITGVIYRNLVLGIALSALPDTMDTSVLQQEVSDLIYSKIGVRSTTFVTTIGAATILTTAQDAAVTAARAAVITNPSSTYYQNQLLITESAALLAKIAALEAYIKSTIPPA